MKKIEAQNMIKDIFESSFDKEKYSYFMRNLLKNIHSAEFSRTGYNIPKAFSEFISLYERIGKFEDEESNLIDILIVKLKRNHSIDYARSSQRNFVRWYLNSKDKDAALVAFYTDKSTDWRFSFIKMQYSLEKKKDDLTPAKRSSFMVGEKGKSHTAQSQLVDILKNDYAPSLSDIEEAFNIEAVSDEFYKKYKNLLFNLVDEIEIIVEKNSKVKAEFKSKNISILNFSKKLLGQIVFLYFLQKKGWLGLGENQKYGDGNKNFLRTLFQNVNKEENFFNDYLEFLFYDALSKKRVTDYYKKFKTRIPFLNGGLFDPIGFYDWEKNDILISNKLFSDIKEDDEGSGVLDVFDLYNFTVKEDEPLDTEVAIDPEMLGKVFERMLEVNERKSKGAFYTPREIVHFMAQNSLLFYLESVFNKSSSFQKLGNNQIEFFGNEGKTGQLDFVIENNNLVVSKQDLETFIHFGEHIIDKDIAIEEGKYSLSNNKQQIPESIRKNANKIDKALENIKICDPAVGSGAFPVGIMNEIVKLRKLLTPFVKEKKSKERNAYLFKANAIQNSIYGVDIDAGAVEIAKLRLWLSMVVDENRIEQIDPLPNLEYKIVKGNSLINMPDGSLRNLVLENEIEKLIKAYYKLTDKNKKKEQKKIIDTKIQEILKYSSELAGYQIDFDFKLFFHEVFDKNDGFDVMIGNPPYVEHKKLKHIAWILKPNYKVYTGSSDLSVYFFETGFNYLKNISGIISFINTNKFFNTGYGKALRNFLLNKQMIQLVNFEQVPIFEKVLVSSVVFIAKNNFIKENQFSYSVFFKEIDWRKNFLQKISERTTNFSQSVFDDGEWNFISGKELDIKKRIENSGNQIQNITSIEIKRGITTGYDPAFVIDKKTKNELQTDIIKHLLKGADIKKYYYRFDFRFLINSHNGIKKKLKPVNIQKDYPQIYKYFIEINKKNDGAVEKRTDKGLHWTNLRNCAFLELFDEEKIIWPLTADRWGFALDDEKHYLTSGGFFMVSNNISHKYLLSILNSKLIQYYFSFIGVMTAGGAYTLKKATIEKFPIKIIILEKQKPFETLVDYIIFLKQQPKDTMSFYFEQIIDGMVYELYFEKELKQESCDVLKYLNILPAFTEEMKDSEKLKTITAVFNKFYDKNSPVRKNLFFMDSVEEIAIIKKGVQK
ncbi:MAG: Eco57I restriction-modification methylase domain-containing protein [Candidatus Cloacimonetes bacterium]|nr:Eco57I restriction-modification methylase domain-containing protein [Candidatus Cloacimonadota bacterium]